MERPKQKSSEIVKAKKAHFNGYIYVDPKVEVGDKVILDEDFANANYVVVMQLGNIFARVRSGDMEWSTMRNRLTHIENDTNENGSDN
jgi:hypothetical protein